MTFNKTVKAWFFSINAIPGHKNYYLGIDNSPFNVILDLSATGISILSLGGGSFGLGFTTFASME